MSSEIARYLLALTLEPIANSAHDVHVHALICATIIMARYNCVLPDIEFKNLLFVVVESFALLPCWKYQKWRNIFTISIIFRRSRHLSKFF